MSNASTTVQVGGSLATTVQVNVDESTEVTFAGVAGPPGPVGPQGAQGATGATGPSPVVNTDGDPGTAIYVGSVDPAVSYTPQTGDVWIEPS